MASLSWKPSQSKLFVCVIFIFLWLPRGNFAYLTKGFVAPDRRSVIVGAGYIAVEMAGILATLGSKTSLVIRQTCVRKKKIANGQLSLRRAVVERRPSLCVRSVGFEKLRRVHQHQLHQGAAEQRRRSVEELSGEVCE